MDELDEAARAISAVFDLAAVSVKNPVAEVCLGMGGRVDQQYLALADAIDETAERSRMLGGTSPGSMSEFLKLARLKEARGALIRGEDALEALAADHASCVRSLRKARGLSFATIRMTPSAVPLRPIFHASATRIPYCSIASGAVDATVSTAICVPLRRS